MFWLFTAARRLREQGILGMNRRNAECILDHNPRALFPVVDDKKRMAELCRSLAVPTPEIYLELSTKGDSEKFIGSDENWRTATDALRVAAEESGLELVPDPGGAAFYGPKISVQARDAIGRSWQMSTIQVDFNLPERFGLEYQSADGTRQRPVMIHRALFGSIERFFGVMTEHYAGAFPAWLAYEQAVVVTVSEKQAEYAEQVVAKLAEKGLRARADLSPDKLGAKIRNARLLRVPYVVVVGDNDIHGTGVKGALATRSFLQGILGDCVKAARPQDRFKDVREQVTAGAWQEGLIVRRPTRLPVTW